MEYLLIAQQLSPDSQLRENYNQIGARILDSIERDGWQCGGPQAVVMPGLMLGIAGIGYQMLRMAEPDIVPSILLLDPPPA